MVVASSLLSITFDRIGHPAHLFRPMLSPLYNNTYLCIYVYIYIYIYKYLYIYTYFIYIILSTYRPYISIHIYTYMIDHQIFISSIFSLTQPQGDVHDSLRPPPPQQPVAQSGRLGKNRGNFSVLPSGKLTVCY